MIRLIFDYFPLGLFVNFIFQLTTFFPCFGIIIKYTSFLL